MSDASEKVFHDVLLLKKLSTKEEVIKRISDHLKSKGYINEQYYQATLDREELFPTGLQTESIGIAIPHSDAVNVNHPAIVMAILDRPVEFADMSNKSNKVDVGVVFFMALKGEDNQINYLRNIADFCKQKSNVEILYNVKDEEEAKKIFVGNILI
ncbi:PTS sugar transporter subunit IIA [Alkalibacter mobilis]|uniref:PTS sugar transporter subunit IIA n=1 Tax=Alkalibacter mobilis TaxID=2787712 RepID=UPI00189D0463|nr:PTS sugar transporter subunit IIA [Alkalibacter mobilis]MBF7097478.1 PTS sugar transporter subunit IIA [Alkalibacter mobilis]